jgi:hypothetical protein
LLKLVASWVLVEQQFCSVTAGRFWSRIDVRRLGRLCRAIAHSVAFVVDRPLFGQFHGSVQCKTNLSSHLGDDHTAGSAVGDAEASSRFPVKKGVPSM